jgi:signal transduction histidine kinase
VGNAARHNPEGAHITVIGRLQDGVLEMEVDDDGDGIAGDQLGRVFDRFERRGGGGSGLGLSIVKQYVELHGGEVWATSQVGAGSKFGFRIPQ